MLHVVINVNRWPEPNIGIITIILWHDVGYKLAFPESETMKTCPSTAAPNSQDSLYHLSASKSEVKSEVKLYLLLQEYDIQTALILHSC